ncbi:hypothetical protein ANANG_G00195370 [Anguilla anguilla]|uniref:Uncharacterized protein n=1 Tax=Anguilla anguilla TaxID=7936 RepID=A0A9D3M1V1_ANGAN|nr:hypothetical protein ANANG_G00195370 [Anguilla anguilla]
MSDPRSRSGAAAKARSREQTQQPGEAEARRRSERERGENNDLPPCVFLCEARSGANATISSGERQAGCDRGRAILGFTGFLDSWVHWAPAGQNHCGGGLAKKTPFTTCAGHRSERTTPRHVTYFGHGKAACGRLLVHPARCSQMA